MRLREDGGACERQCDLLEHEASCLPVVAYYAPDTEQPESMLHMNGDSHTRKRSYAVAVELA